MLHSHWRSARQPGCNCESVATGYNLDFIGFFAAKNPMISRHLSNTVNTRIFTHKYPEFYRIR
jgi:hypothetical protein